MQHRSLRRLAVAAGLAGVLVAAGIAVSAAGGPESASNPNATGATARLFRGIPERDGVLGDPKAPVTLTEFVDLQCPICAQASQAILPALLEEYVRTGKVRLDVGTLHFLGPDSERAARVAAGAREQGRLWPFLHAFFAAQGAENSGYVTDAFLGDVAKAAGVDAKQAFDHAGSSAAQAVLDEANESAAALGVQATPTFVLERAGGSAESLGSGVPDLDKLRAALDAAATQ